MSEPSAKDLNTVYAASLEFGKHWRDPIADLARERLPARSAEYRDSLATQVDTCRREIEEYIQSQCHLRAVFHPHGVGWSRAEEREARQWIALHYPWMNGRNQSHAVSQGLFYAQRD